MRSLAAERLPGDIRSHNPAIVLAVDSRCIPRGLGRRSSRSRVAAATGELKLDGVHIIEERVPNHLDQLKGLALERLGHKHLDRTMRCDILRHRGEWYQPAADWRARRAGSRDET